MSRRLFAVILMVFSCAALTFAQGGAVKSSAQGAGAVPSGKIAIIDSRSFGEGIVEMKKQLDKLEGEFQPRYKELEGMQQQLVKLDDDLKNPKGDQKTLQQKADQMQVIKKD